ncbi:MAG TPA: glycosyltransferase [Cyclobacteriaceae bacterium]|nr:glycosyltransferase [Cyclobacteriaceae bacterium]
MNAYELIYFVAEKGILIYAIAICSAYLVLAILSRIEMRKYISKNYFVDHKVILSSPLAPSVTLVAPAYNEGLTITDNVKSLLSIMYNNYEVIIINDGSKDDTIEKLIAEFDLRKVEYVFKESIKTKPIRGIYKSTNRAFKKLLVVDKENGGKADALNVGLNLSANELVACIDVDCIIEPDALLKMVKPFMQEEETVIATGGVVRIANSCVIEEGRLVEVKLPESLLARFQVLEYLRAFLLGRMAWSRLNGLLIISGAFGLFKREIALNCGGFDHDTVGEDMELVVRMRRYMHEQKLPYKVVYIPDPLCWTEAPANNRILGRQRNRWARGTIETLLKHKKMFLNPRYGLMGVLSFPFWLIFEWLAPFIEFFGIVYFIVMTIIGRIDWIFFLSMLGAIYCFALFISAWSLLAEELSYFKYTRKRDIFKMIIVAMIEPIIYHPRIVWWSIKGNFDFWKGKKSWGEMTRQGFVQYKKTETAVKTS